MSDVQTELIELFSQLSTDQQQDILMLMKTWTTQQRNTAAALPAAVQSDAGKPLNSVMQDPSLSKEWHCLNALKEVVERHYYPTMELAYIAFNPNLDSISTAKTRAAVKQMYVLEAAYELKRILENNPNSELLDADVLNSLQEYLHRDRS